MDFTGDHDDHVVRKGMNWYIELIKTAAARTGYMPAQQSENYPVSTQLQRRRVYDSRRSAERHADGDLYYRNAQKGLPVVYPVTVIRMTRWLDMGYSYEADVLITGPAELTEKGKRLADTNEYLQLFDFNGYSAGHHGYDDVPERGAGDPRGSTEWEPLVSEAVLRAMDQIGKGSTVILAGDDDGSFHERWFHGGIYISANHEQQLALEQVDPSLSYGRVDERHKVKERIPFVSVADVIEKASNSLELEPPTNSPFVNKWEKPVQQPQQPQQMDPLKPQPGETSQQYWDRQIKWRTIGKYGPRTGD